MGKINVNYDIDGIPITIKYRTKKEREIIEDRLMFILQQDIFKGNHGE